MSSFNKIVNFLLCITTILFVSTAYAKTTQNIPILVYHNFNPTKPGSMNLKPARFEEQVKWLKDNGFTFIPLQEAVNYLQGKQESLPTKPVVITADDGWQSVYKYMYPIVKKYKIPVTLFIYPAPISHSKHFMTWEELIELQKTGLFDIQGHTYSHPNFKHEKKRLSPAAYDKLVQKELVGSKKILEDKLGTKINLLAWPFGIYNDDLEQEAKKAGYTMAFSIDYHTANRNFRSMAQPRFMIVASESPKIFRGIVNGASKISPIKTDKSTSKDH